MRLKLIALILIIAVCAFGSKIRLSQGAVYSGKIVGENDNFITVSVNGAQIRILKTLISEIDGRPYRCLRNAGIADNNHLVSQSSNGTSAVSSKIDNSAISQSITANAPQAPVQAKPQTARHVNLSLYNGKSLSGRMVSEDDTSVAVSSNGQVFLFDKDSISGMEKYDVTIDDNTAAADKAAADKAAADKVAADKVAADKVAADKVAADKVAADKVAADKVAADKVAADKVAADKVAADKVAADKVAADKVAADKVAADKVAADKVAADKVANDKVANDKVANDKVANDKVANDNVSISVNIIEEKLKSPQNTDTAMKTVSQNNANNIYPQPKTMPPLPPELVNPGKRSDGKIKVTLKNGASFIGRIISENERFLRFESEGTTINIIRQLIKDIDGEAPDSQSATASGDLIVKPDNMPHRTAVSSVNTETPPDLRRAYPALSITKELSVKQLIDSMQSPKWETRSQSARYAAAMGQWGTEAIPALKKLLSDTILSTSYEPVWIDSTNVNKLLVPGDEAARTLSRMGDGGFSALRMLCKDSNAVVRRRAAFGMGEYTNEQAWAILQEMLQDPDRGVRAVAVTGLRSPQFVGAISLMLKDEDTEVRADAAFMLGKIRDKKAVKSLRPLLYDKRSIVRTQAADALCKIGGAEAMQHLINASKDASISVRENAALALGETGDSLAVQPLINLLHDKIISVRVAAIDALAHIRDPRAIPSLYSMMKDDDPQVQEQARLSLKKHTDLWSLIDAIDNSYANVRDNVLYMLWLLSGQNFGTDKKLWVDWYKKSIETKR